MGSGHKPQPRDGAARPENFDRSSLDRQRSARDAETIGLAPRDRAATMAAHAAGCAPAADGGGKSNSKYELRVNSHPPYTADTRAQHQRLKIWPTPLPPRRGPLLEELSMFNLVSRAARLCGQLALVSALAVSSAFAQSGAGSGLSGRVRDSSGASMAGVTVTVTRPRYRHSSGPRRPMRRATGKCASCRPAPTASHSTRRASRRCSATASSSHRTDGHGRRGARGRAASARRSP